MKQLFLLHDAPQLLRKTVLASSSGLLLSIVMNTSCKPVNVPKQFAILDGDRLEGTVTLYYDYVRFREKPQPQFDQGLALARQFCRAWGYADAIWFGPPEEDDLDGHFNVIRVEQKAQCTVLPVPAYQLQSTTRE